MSTRKQCRNHLPFVTTLTTSSGISQKSCSSLLWSSTGRFKQSFRYAMSTLWRSMISSGLSRPNICFGGSPPALSEILPLFGKSLDFEKSKKSPHDSWAAVSQKIGFDPWFFERRSNTQPTRHWKKNLKKRIRRWMIIKNCKKTIRKMINSKYNSNRN